MPRMSQTCLSVTFSSSFLTEGYEVQQYYRPHAGQRQKQAVMTKRANSWGNVLYIGGEMQRNCGSGRKPGEGNEKLKSPGKIVSAGQYA